MTENRWLQTRLGGVPPVLVVASLALCAARLVVAAESGLTDDEAYYRLWGLAPALSYLDHPPLTGWLIAAGRSIAGDTALGVRLAAVLAPLLGTLLAWRTARLLFGETVAARASLFILAMPLLAAGGVTMTPDVPSVLCWGLTGWAVAELHVSGRPGWWLAIGAFAGLGLLAKYTNLFAGAGIVLWLLVSARARPWLGAWQLWLGSGIAGLCTLPVLWWNVAHHWASFDKQFGRVGAGEGLTLRFLGEFAGGLFALIGPAVAILAAIGLWHCLKQTRQDRDGAHALLLWSIIPLGLYLLVHASHDRVQANWPAPIYPAFAILAALALERLAAGQYRDGGFVAWLGRLALPIGWSMCALLYLHALHPLIRLPGDADPTSQMRGWSDFAAKVEAQRLQAGARWVATSSYATTGQLAFAMPASVAVLQLNERIRYVHLPVVSDAILQAPALYVELQWREDPALLRARFGSVVPAGTLTRADAGVVIATYAIYRLADPLGPALPPAD